MRLFILTMFGAVFAFAGNTQTSSSQVCSDPAELTEDIIKERALAHQPRIDIFRTRIDGTNLTIQLAASRPDNDDRSEADFINGVLKQLFYPCVPDDLALSFKPVSEVVLNDEERSLFFETRIGAAHLDGSSAQILVNKAGTITSIRSTILSTQTLIEARADLSDGFELIFDKEWDADISFGVLRNAATQSGIELLRSEDLSEFIVLTGSADLDYLQARDDGLKVAIDRTKGITPYYNITFLAQSDLSDEVSIVDIDYDIRAQRSTIAQKYPVAPKEGLQSVPTTVSNLAAMSGRIPYPVDLKHLTPIKLAPSNYRSGTSKDRPPLRNFYILCPDGFCQLSGILFIPEGTSLPDPTTGMLASSRAKSMVHIYSNQQFEHFQIPELGENTVISDRQGHWWPDPNERYGEYSGAQLIAALDAFYWTSVYLDFYINNLNQGKCLDARYTGNKCQYCPAQSVVVDFDTIGYGEFIASGLKTRSDPHAILSNEMCSRSVFDRQAQALTTRGPGAYMLYGRTDKTGASAPFFQSSASDPFVVGHELMHLVMAAPELMGFPAVPCTNDRNWEIDTVMESMADTVSFFSSRALLGAWDYAPRANRLGIHSFPQPLVRSMTDPAQGDDLEEFRKSRSFRINPTYSTWLEYWTSPGSVDGYRLADSSVSSRFLS